MSPRHPKKPYHTGGYTCAEDLCDPTHSAGEASPEVSLRPRRRAVRLMDEMGGGHDPAEAPLPTHRVIEQAAFPANEAEVYVPRGRQARRPARPQASLPARGRDDLAADACAVLSVRPSGEGDVVAVTLAMPTAAPSDATVDTTVDGPAAAPAPRHERVRLYLLVEQYADLRPEEGNISLEEAEALLAAGRLCAAVKRGMNLLQYGDRSAKKLAYKLTTKGIDRETAALAAAYLTEKGYIREDNTARLRAEQDVRKGWGPRRIREDLRAGGFTAEAVEEAMALLLEVDFEENCTRVIRKKYRRIPEDYAERQKMTAALMRLGYDHDVIRAALRRVAHDE